MNRPHPLHLLLVVGTLVLALAPSASAAGLKAPTLASPDDDQQVSAVPAFTWNKVRSADRYEFQLSADQNFGSIVLGRGLGSFTTKNLAATITKSLPDGTYWWRVRAISAANKAGAWSTRRSIRKAWAPAPQLQSPVDVKSIAFPAEPLVLKWSAVPRAFKYRVFIATDPGLGTLAVGKEPIETSATVFSPSGSLTPGRYYWAVQPVDAAGHRGPRSEVASFVWSWPSATQTSYLDLIEDPRIADPRVSWSPVGGAVAYEVEINHSPDFAPGSRVCCTDAVLGTSYAPKTILPNNVYHWRVRAIDANGNSGQWNNGPDFDKNFGNAPITGLRVADPGHDDRAVDRDATTPGLLDTAAPVVRWDPVPGAAKYHVKVWPAIGNACDLTDPGLEAITAATSWTPLTTRTAAPPIPVPSGVISSEGGLVSGVSYCVEVYAITGNDAVRSAVTQLGGPGAIAFRYLPDPVAPVEGAVTMTEGSYIAPGSGSTTSRVPVFTWEPVPGAASYWVIVARDAEFTTIVDVALTRNPAYAPRANRNPRTYRDEDTPYWWAVVPAREPGGGGVSYGPALNAPRTFIKRSTPPALLAPADGETIAETPVFRWTSGDGSIGVPPEGADSYRLEVAQDEAFGQIVDTVTTQATSYTAEEAYPADTVLYWRVRVTDTNGVALAWSRTGKFRRSLPVPTIFADNAQGGSFIPALSWTPVQGAVSYDVHVDQSDGTRKDFKLRGTAFTPNVWYGTGVWRWQVRANFPGGEAREVSSAYSPPASFARRIPSPDGVNAETRDGRILIRWEPNLGAGIKEYKVDFSDSDSFATIGQSIRTQNLVVAPDVTKAPFANGGAVYWRIFAIDEGGNLGGAAAGRFSTAKKLLLKVAGSLARGKTGTLRVSTADAAGRKVRKARVRISGRPVRTVSKRTGKGGTVAFRLRARRKGTVVIRATRDGYRPTQARLTVR